MKNEYKVFACVERKHRVRGMVFSGILMALCVIALMLGIYSFTTDNPVFGVSYMIAIVLGLSYIIIKINQLFPTYVAADDDNLILRCWDNHFFPYNAWNGIPVIREFIPSRSQKVVIPMAEITTLIIGTKSYVKRNALDEAFNKEVLPYEKNRYSSITSSLDKANILYIKINNGDSCFMSIEGFNPKETMEVLNQFTSSCSDSVDVKINSRAFKRYLRLPERVQDTKEETDSE